MARSPRRQAACLRGGSALSNRRLRALQRHLPQGNPPPPRQRAAASPAAAGSVDALIIGAGFGGLCACKKLRDELGLDVQILEAGSGVGGTWYWNRYPGARCDVHSVEYSFSFDVALEQEWDWQEVMAAQPQILQYADHVADRFDMRRSILFDTRVNGCSWDEAARLWRVSTEVRRNPYSRCFADGAWL
jgi:cyclohexanone monooxygenase